MSTPFHGRIFTFTQPDGTRVRVRGFGDLRLTLHSPSGDEVELHDQAGGSTANLRETCMAAATPGLWGLVGKPIAGHWQLGVADLAASDVGKLNRWKVVIRPVT
jgi:subtilisin-like proprotein convertase family protein